MKRLTVDLIRVEEVGPDPSRLDARERDPFLEASLRDLGFEPVGALRSLGADDDEPEEVPAIDPSARRAPLQLLRLRRQRGVGEAVYRDPDGEMYAGVEVSDEGAWLVFLTLMEDGSVLRTVVRPRRAVGASTWRPPIDRVAAWLAGDSVSNRFPPVPGAGLLQSVWEGIAPAAAVAQHRHAVVAEVMAGRRPVEHRELELAAAVERRTVHVFEARLHRLHRSRLAAGWVTFFATAVALSTAVPSGRGFFVAMLIGGSLWATCLSLVAYLRGGALWPALLMPPFTLMVGGVADLAPGRTAAALALGAGVRLMGELTDVALQGRLGAWLAGRQTEPERVPARELLMAYHR